MYIHIDSPVLPPSVVMAAIQPAMHLLIAPSSKASPTVTVTPANDSKTSLVSYILHKYMYKTSHINSEYSVQECVYLSAYNYR
jgi:hypothetical protein